MDRVFSTLTVRTISEDQRIIEGIATTSRADRAGDIVESLGAEFDLPIPFLLDHNPLDAVGEVEAAEVTKDGIRFRARIKKITEPGEVKDLCDRAWSLIRNGLRRAVSIGFRPLDYEAMPGGGYRFRTWEWLELSACAVPCNADARVTGLKAEPRLARGNEIIAANKKKIREAALIRSVEQQVRLKRLGIPPAPRVVTITAADKAAFRRAATNRAPRKGVVTLGTAKRTRIVKL